MWILIYHFQSFADYRFILSLTDNMTQTLSQGLSQRCSGIVSGKCLLIPFVWSAWLYPCLYPLIVIRINDEPVLIHYPFLVA